MKRLLLILAAVPLSGCSLTPVERAALLELGLRAAESRLIKHQK